LTFTIQPAWCRYRGDAAVAIAAVLEGERRDVNGQRLFIIRLPGDLALRGTMLAENPAGASLGHAQFLDDMTHASAATGRA
jgi:hypothetical protein